MTNPDPLLMSADITILEAERPDLDVELIAAIYRHLLAARGRQPTLREFRRYVDRVSCLGVEMLREHLGLEVRRPHDPTPTRPAQRAANDRPAAGASGPGRPGWTRELFATRYRAARERATPPYTYRSIAAHFEMLDGGVGADPDHLRKLMKRYGQAPG